MNTLLSLMQAQELKYKPQKNNKTLKHCEFINKFGYCEIQKHLFYRIKKSKKPAGSRAGFYHMGNKKYYLTYLSKTYKLVDMVYYYHNKELPETNLIAIDGDNSNTSYENLKLGKRKW